MPPRLAYISELLNSLDAATYFFVSSGIFIAVAAVLFFFLGLWLGGLIWAHYKRRFRNAEQAIEAFKGEVALLKRRLAEQSTRPSPTMGPSPLQSIAFRAAPQHEVAAFSTPAVATIHAAAIRAGAPFTVWTEAGWAPAQPLEASLSAVVRAGATTVTAARQETHPILTTATTATLPEWRLLFAPTEVFMVPHSRAFCIWTERSWNPPAIKLAPLPRALGFALWTQSDFAPACRGPVMPSRAHTLWTVPDWTLSYRPGPPARAARSFTLWTEPGWMPASIVPRSRAFSLWTESSWVPRRVEPAPTPEAASWSLWTSPDFMPACRGVLLPSRAFTLWTQPDGQTPEHSPQGHHVGRPFTLWTEAEPPGIHASATGKQSRTEAATATAAATQAAKKQGFVARAMAAARQALGFSRPSTTTSAGEPASDVSPATGSHDSDSSPKPTPKAKTPAPVPKNTGPVAAAVVTAKATLAPAPVEASEVVASKEASSDAKSVQEISKGKVPVVAAFSGPWPASKAFTIWTGAAANRSGKRINQSAALAALIESKTAGTTPGTQPAHAPAVPPVPVVEGPDAESVTQNSSATLLPPLDLEPLSVPGESSPH